MTRNAPPSVTRDAVVIANIVGFACVSAADAWGVSHGDSRPVAKLFLLIHSLMTAALVIAHRRSKHASG
jgi:hypothetical protein